MARNIKIYEYSKMYLKTVQNISKQWIRISLCSKQKEQEVQSKKIYNALKYKCSPFIGK